MKMNIEHQVAYLMQGTEYGDENLKLAMAEDLRQRLIDAEREGRPLRVYCGFDPTSSDLHLGHTVPMRKLRQFQELGHDVTFLVGTFTSQIGDPSDQNKLRPRLTHEQVEYNARTYAEQAYKVLDREKTAIRYNAEWLSELSFAELIQLAANFTLQQFLERDNFRERWEKGDPIFLHETFYAIMQGYDAYMLKADVQVGGTDQLFNIVTAARKLMPYLGVKPNVGVILGILPGTDGVVKMSKSLGNHIPLMSTPEDMYGKVMSVPDAAMRQYFRLVTRWNPDQIAELENGLEVGNLHPRDVKMKLALEIVSIFYSPSEAEKAQDEFVQVFQHRENPDEMQEYHPGGERSLLNILLASGLVASKSEGRRLISQNGIRFEGSTVSDPAYELSTSGVLQVGKRRFVKVILE